MHIRHLNISHPKILINMDVDIHLFYKLVCVSRCSTSNCKYLRLCPHRLRNRLWLSHSLYVSVFFCLFFIIIIFFYPLWLSHLESRQVSFFFSLFFFLFFIVISSVLLSSLFCFFFTIFFFCFLLVFYLHFFINTYYTYFFKCTLNTVLDKCTWYLIEQHWGIVRTIQIMRYYTYLNVKYGYVNNHEEDYRGMWVGLGGSCQYVRLRRFNVRSDALTLTSRDSNVDGYKNCGCIFPSSPQGHDQCFSFLGFGLKILACFFLLRVRNSNMY